MRLTYDPKTDRLRIVLHAGRIAESEELEPGVRVDFDDEGHVLGLQLEDARRRLTLEELTTVTYENVALQRRSSLTLP